MLGSSYELGNKISTWAPNIFPIIIAPFVLVIILYPTMHTYGQDKQKMMEEFLHFPQRENMNIKENHVA